MSVRDRGARFGKYELIAELPRERDAGDADLYLAAAVAPGGYATLAVIRPISPPALDDDARDELPLRARLKHANIVETYEIAAATEAALAFVATEYVEGQPLARILERIGVKGLGRGKFLRILIDVLAGLHYAHEALDDAGRPLHLAHRALTSARVFVTYDGQVKVDFLPREMDLADTRAASFAPEQARGEPADRRADIFAVGALLWEASTGTRLWGGESGEENEASGASEASGAKEASTNARALAELANGRIPSLHAAKPSVPPLLADIVARALAPNADDRYSTAMHLQADLEGFLLTSVTSDETATPKEIGRVVAHAFLEERLRTTTIVDEQLRRLRARALATKAADSAPSTTVSLLRIETVPQHLSRQPRGTTPASRPLTPHGPLAPRAVAHSLSALSLFAASRRGRVLIAAGVAFVVVLVALVLARAR
jgi:serine/threonine protein kinase